MKISSKHYYRSRLFPIHHLSFDLPSQSTVRFLAWSFDVRPEVFVLMVSATDRGSKPAYGKRVGPTDAADGCEGNSWLLKRISSEKLFLICVSD